MKRVTKRAIVVGVAGLLAMFSVLTAAPAAANAPCTAGEGGFCGQEFRGFYGGPNLASERGEAQTSIEPDRVTQRDFDSVVATDRVRGR